MSDSIPTLEELRNMPNAAWLWDGARARVVWANPRGIAYFGCEFLFELIERPFDVQEPGVLSLISLSQELSRGEIRQLELSFPSADVGEPLCCSATVHMLADGRPGLLVIARPLQTPEPDQPASPDPRALKQAFELLPFGAGFIDREGGLHHVNESARNLLAAAQRQSLASLLDNRLLAEQIYERLNKSAILSIIHPCSTLIGKRDLRLTIRRLAIDGAISLQALLLIEDITERRALARQHAQMLQDSEQADHDAHDISSVQDGKIKGASGLERSGGTLSPHLPLLSAADIAAFEALGAMLKEKLCPDFQPSVESCSNNNEPPAFISSNTLVQEKVEQKSLVLLPDCSEQISNIPEFVRNNLDQLNEAILIFQTGKLLYVNGAARHLFAGQDLESLLCDLVLERSLAQAVESGNLKVRLDYGKDQFLECNLLITPVPWSGGAAQQISLTPVKPPEEKVDAITRPLPMIADHVDIGPENPISPGITPLTSDEELRAILDMASDGIIILDVDGKIHDFSAGAEAIFGYRLAEVLDKPIFELLAPPSCKIVQDYLSALSGSGLASVFNDGREVSAIVKQGGTVPLFLTIGKLQSARRPKVFCAVVRDITQWKKTEIDLRLAKEAAEVASRQKSDFLAKVSYELRTPLNAILGFSDVLRQERFGKLPNEKYRDYINDIHHCGTHLLSLVNDLLDLSKIEAGRLELDFTALNLSELVDHIIHFLMEIAAAARVVVRKSIPRDLPNIVADQRSLRQIMLHLVSNAIKYTEPGGQVIISAFLAPGGELKLRVKDTGIGMDEAQLRSALQPFQHITTHNHDNSSSPQLRGSPDRSLSPQLRGSPDRSLSPQPDGSPGRVGTGLGLSLTKSLIEANRAQLEISSAPRKGTLVEVTFPVARVLAN